MKTFDYLFYSIATLLIINSIIYPEDSYAQTKLSQNWRQEATWLNYNSNQPINTPELPFRLYGQTGNTQVGNFVVPVMPASTIYQRPTEIILPSRNNSSTYGSDMFRASLPSVIGGYGYPGINPYFGNRYGYGYGYGISPFGFGSGFGLGFNPIMPFAGGFGNFGGFARPFNNMGGFGWRSPYYGFFNPAAGALFAGASAGSFNNSTLGKVTPARVIQTQPSKASGNYYQPSTVDSTASGSYYANTGGGAMPIITSPEPVKDYWGPAGNPFPANYGETR
jgi:hypothetical protein